jgi:hypothetical protein
MAAALFSVACSPAALAQARPVAPDRVQPSAARAQTAPASKLQTPAEQVLLPFLKAHTPLAAEATNGLLQPMGDDDTTTPPFGGYVNAPMFDARTTASTDTGVFNNGTTVELGADFNKDGKTDIAVLQQDGTLNILLNNGNSGLNAPVSYLNPNFQKGTINNAYAVDVNGDGYADIVAFDFNNNSTITWLNLGNGTFNAAVTTLLDTTYGYPNMVYLADVNADGKADLIFGTIALQGQSSATVYLEAQLGAGDGTFGPPSAAKVESFTFAGSGIMPASAGIAVADINGDGKLDIALAIDERFSQTTGTYVVTTALGNNDGTFTGLGTLFPISIPSVAPPLSPAVPYYATILSLTDVNGDGRPDLVADLNGTLETALGRSDGTFSAAVSSDISAIQQAVQTVLLDVNNDGKPDAIVGGGTLGVYLGNGDGTFAPPVAGSQYAIDGIDEGQELAVADFNNDGIPDLAQLSPTYKQVSLFFNTGQGGFRGAPVITVENPNAFASQLATSGTYTSSGYSDPLFSYTGGAAAELVTEVSNGKGGFTSVQALPAFPAKVQYFQPIHADYNGDGLEDIIYADTTGDVDVALSKGDGTFATPVPVGLPATACPVYYGAAGDVNGDGKVDLVLPYGGDAACEATTGGASGYYVALGKGDGTFSPATFTSFGTELYKVALGDINDDGNLDLIIDDDPVISGSGFEVSAALGNGDGTFGVPNTIVQDYVVSDLAVADINNDGLADLVLTAEEVENSDVYTGGILTITGNGDGTFNTPSLIATGNYFWGLQVTDMNNDGNADIVATLFQKPDQPVNYYGMVTLLGYGNGQFAAPYNSLIGLGATLPVAGHFVNDGAWDVLVDGAYGAALFIGQGGSTLTLSTSATLISVGAEETLTATLTSSMTGRPAASGTVSFYDGTTLLGTGTLSSGTATLSTATLAAGTHTVKAMYSGDSNFNPATSGASTITVTALPSAFTLSGTPSTVTVTGGAQGLVTLSVAANASFSGAVNLTCTGMPANSTCTVNPGNVTLAAGSTSTATVVIGTTGTIAELKPSSPWNTPGAAVSLAAMFGIFFGRRKRLRALSALCFALALSAGTLLTGCGGGSAPPPTNNSAPSAPVVKAGTYTLIITAAPASGSTVGTQTIPVTLVVN